MIKTIDTETITPKMIAAMCDHCEAVNYLPYKDVVKGLIAFLDAAPEVSEKQQQFAERIAAKERKEIYELVQKERNHEDTNVTQYMSGQYDMADHICALIRARGEK